jgi:hypothetical protein
LLKAILRAVLGPVRSETQECIKAACDVLGTVFTGALVLGTGCLALFTYKLVVATQELFKETKVAAARQLGVNTWLYFVNRWDSGEMQLKRKKLAIAIVPQHDMGESHTVLDFFEQVGTAYRLGCIDKELVYSSLSYDAKNWWIILKKEVERVRVQLKDNKVYDEFEAMIESLRAVHPDDPIPNLRDAEENYLKEEIAL